MEGVLYRHWYSICVIYNTVVGTDRCFVDTGWCAIGTGVGVL